MNDGTTDIHDLDGWAALAPAGRLPDSCKRQPASADPAAFCLEARQLAAHAFVVSAAEIDSRSLTRHVARARQVAMYLSNVAGGVALGHVGARFGRDRRTAAHACAVVEDMRDDPDADLALTMLEGALRAVFRLGPADIDKPLPPLPKPSRNVTRP